MELNIGDMKDEHNKILLSMKYKKIKPKVEYLFKKNGTLLLNRSNHDHFHSSAVYIPLTTLLRFGLENEVKAICNELSEHLDRKTKKWDFPLFQNFTHVLNRTTWWGESFPNHGLLYKYLQLAIQWLNTYESNIITNFCGYNKSKLRQTKSSLRNKIDMILQFKTLLHIPISKKTQSQILLLLSMSHTKQTEHLYMLMKMNETFFV